MLPEGFRLRRSRRRFLAPRVLCQGCTRGLSDGFLASQQLIFQHLLGRMSLQPRPRALLPRFPSRSSSHALRRVFSRPCANAALLSVAWHSVLSMHSFRGALRLERLSRRQRWLWMPSRQASSALLQIQLELLSHVLGINLDSIGDYQGLAKRILDVHFSLLNSALNTHAGLTSAAKSAWAGLAAGFLHTLCGPDHLAVRMTAPARGWRLPGSRVAGEGGCGKPPRGAAGTGGAAARRPRDPGHATMWVECRRETTWTYVIGVA